jgi:hypothetical protein
MLAEFWLKEYSSSEELAGVALEETAAGEEAVPVGPHAQRTNAAKAAKPNFAIFELLTIKFTLLSKLVRAPHSK